ncbi:hypothetical protein AAG906_026896 [Vitis piasezkii]
MVVYAGTNENEWIFTGELKDINVTCGYTSRKYGDTTGRLRIFVGGQLEISCECVAGCSEDKLTLAQFESHFGRGHPKRSGRAALIRGWPQGQKGSTIPQGNLGRREWALTSQKSYDEFIFECCIHHDASINKNWNCVDP